MPEELLSLSRLVAGPFPAIEEALLSRLPARFAAPPGREHILLVPSNDLREHLLRRLAARWTGAAAGFSVLTLYDFAVRLLKHRGVPAPELSPAALHAALWAAVKDVYGGGRGGLARIARTPGFLPALAATLADLEEGLVAGRDLAEAARRARARGEEEGAERWQEWERLLAAVERRVEAAGGMTRRRIFQEAVAGFEQPGYPFRVALYGFYDFTRLQWTLVEALLASGLLEEVYVPILFGPDGSPAPAFAYAAATWERLLRAFEGNADIVAGEVPEALALVRARHFAGGDPKEARRAAPVSLLLAPHEEGQWRLAARRVRRWLEEDPGCEVLVVAREFDEAAARTWQRMAREYGIPAADRLSVPLASAPLARLLVQMIAAAVDGFPRAAVMEILASPYRRLATAERRPPPRPELWDVLSRQAGIAGGSDWDDRLAGPVPARAPKERDEESEGDGDASDPERAEQFRLLGEEFRALRQALRPLGAAGSFPELARLIGGLLRSQFVIPDDGSAEAERDGRTLLALARLLDEVERLPEGAAPWPGAVEALAWFRMLVEARPLFVGEKGGLRRPGAVAAGDLFSLRGVTADRILFLSVNEGTVPAQREEDPLLGDEEREELNRLLRRPGLPDALPLRRRRSAEEKLLFALPALSARKEVAWGVLRSDASGAARRPSRYLLDLLSRFAGPEVFSEQWAERSGAAVETLPRDPFAALEGDGPQSARERALAAWRRGEWPQDPSWAAAARRGARIAAALAARRRGEALFPSSGPGRPPGRPASAAELDEIARCPYRFFLERCAGLAPVEDPEKTAILSRAEAGLIAHEILAVLGRAAASGGGWGDPASAAERVVERRAARRPEGLPGLERLLCARIAEDVARLVERERRRAAAGQGGAVLDVERAFSLPAAPGRPSLVGRVDRIDRTPEGGVEIVDYKYRDGRAGGIPWDWIALGLSSQVPVYFLFAEHLLPGGREAAVTLLFFEKEVRAVTAPPDRWGRVRGAWEEAAGRWLALAGSGPFPPLPHHRFGYGRAAPPRYCGTCPFADHCRVAPDSRGSEGDLAALAARIAGDPALGAVAASRPPRGS